MSKAEDDYDEAIRMARSAAACAHDLRTPESVHAWTDVAKVWLAIAREIREARKEEQ